MLVSQSMIRLVRHPVNSLEIVSTNEIGRQSFKVVHSSFFGIKTVREVFHANGMRLYLRQRVKMLDRAWASGSIDLQYSKVSLFNPGAVFSAVDKRAQISPGDILSRLISSAVDSQLS